MDKFVISLWFEERALEAATFYTRLFPDSAVDQISYAGESLPNIPGSVVTVSFHLAEQPFLAINGGTAFQFTPAISLLVNCDSQDEVDRYWEALGEKGNYMQCGWLTDRFGITWQIVPRRLGELMSDPDAQKVERVTKAMLQMIKLDSAALQAAYDGEDQETPG